ncbi:MAG: immunoglobulin-like domain-containing protein [Candidatus Onthomonas sp.]
MKQMKAISLQLALCLALTGCGAAEITSDEPGCEAVEPGASVAAGLLQTASPETSALILFYYDGETVTSRTLYDEERELALLERINALPAQEAEEVDLSQWSLPCYGLWISAQDGTDLYAAWSEGLWLGGDGSVWQVEADFPDYWQLLEGEDEDNSLSVLSFPCAGLLASCDDRFLAPAEEYTIANLPLRTYLTVLDVTDGITTVRIDNQSGYEMSYSEYYSLQVERDGEWFTLPPRETLAFNDIAYVLQDLEQATVTCDLTVYGDLTAGHYRLVKDDMAAEFWLDGQGALCEKPDGTDAAPEPGVSMEVFAEDLTAVRVLLHNDTDQDTGYLWDFTLWKREVDGWVSVPFLEPYGICGVQDPLPAGETVELFLDLESLFGALEDGQYRLLMESEGWAASFEINHET